MNTAKNLLLLLARLLLLSLSRQCLSDGVDVYKNANRPTLGIRQQVDLEFQSDLSFSKPWIIQQKQARASNKNDSFIGAAFQFLFEWPRFHRGQAFDVYVEGDIGYMALGHGGLGVFHVRDPALPTPLSGLATDMFVEGVFVTNRIAYLAGSTGLQIIDVRDPERPLLLGTVGTSAWATKVLVVDNIAYVTHLSGLTTVDVTSSRSPAVLGNIRTSGARKSISIDRNFAFLGGGANRGLIEVVDISDPRNLVQVFSDQDIGCNAIKISGHRGYIANSGSGLSIFDISDPRRLRKIGGARGADEPNGISISGTKAYLSTSAGLEIFDISNPEAPLFLENVQTEQSASSVFLNNGHIWIGQQEFGFEVFQSRADLSPSRIGSIPTEPYAASVDVTIQGDLIYVADYHGGLKILKIENPNGVRLVGDLKSIGAVNSISVSGGVVYVGSNRGFFIIDGSRPEEPRVIGQVPGSGTVYGVKVVDNVAYTIGTAGFESIDVSNPSLPIRLGRYSEVHGISLEISGKTAFISNVGIVALDVSDPRVPRRLGEIASSLSQGIRVAGNVAYLSTFGGVDVIDVSNPERMTFIDEYRTAGAVQEIEIVGNRGYLAIDNSEVHIVDLSNPRQIVQLKAITIPGKVTGIDISSSRAAVSVGAWGVQLYNIDSSRIEQAISFSPPISITMLQSRIQLEASSSSRLPVSFEILSGPAQLDGSILSPTGEGRVTLRAVQGGSDRFLSASVLRNIDVVKATQEITWSSNEEFQSLTFGRGYSFNPTSSSGLPVQLSVQSGPAQIVSGSVFATNHGEIQILASQNGNAIYNSATSIRTFNRSSFLGVEKIGGWSNNLSGAVISLDIQGDLACALWGYWLMTVDILDPISPRQLGILQLEGDARDVKIRNNIAYIANGRHGVLLVDISDPLKPIRLGKYTENVYATAVKVDGARLYVSDEFVGLQIFDISNPMSLSRIGPFDYMSWLAPARGVQIFDETIFLMHGGALELLQTTADLRTQRLAFYAFDKLRAMNVKSNIAFLYGGEPARLEIVDFQNPRLPVRLNRIETGGTAFSIEVDRGIAAVMGSNGIKIVNVENPRDAKVISSLQPDLVAFGMKLHGNFAYVAGGDLGLRIFDIRDPAQPLYQSDFETTSDFRGVHVQDGIAYIANGAQGVRLMEVVGGTSPRSLGKLFTGGIVNDVKVAGAIVYLADDAFGLELVDISNLTNLLSRGRITVGDGCQSLYIENDKMFVAAETAGFQVYDLSQNGVPRRIGGLAMNGIVSKALVIGKTAYIAHDPGGFLIVDVSIPTAPTILSQSVVQDRVLDVCVKNGIAYIPYTDGTVQLYDIRNPRLPVRMGKVGSFGPISCVKMLGSVMLVGVGRQGVKIVDVSNPLIPRTIGQYDTFGSVKGIDVVGNIAYIADGYGGLDVIRVNNGVQQEVKFDLPAELQLDVGSVLLSAEASSGLPVSFRVISGPGEILESRLVFHGLGEIVIRAEQQGGEQFLYASVDKTLKIVDVRNRVRLVPEMLFGGSRFRLFAEGPPGAWGVLFSSSDLVNWAPIRTNQYPSEFEFITRDLGESRFFEIRDR